MFSSETSGRAGRVFLLPPNINQAGEHTVFTRLKQRVVRVDMALELPSIGGRAVFRPGNKTVHRAGRLVPPANAPNLFRAEHVRDAVGA